jgi:glycosyltransferase involved in cell wall biosynthesis
LEAGRHLLLADGAEAFARKISHLLENPAKAEILGKSGRQLVEHTYSWPVCAKKLEAVWTNFAPH